MIKEISNIKHEFAIRDLLVFLTTHDLAEESELETIYAKILSIYNASQRLSYYCISEYIIEEYNKDKFTPDILTDQILYFIEKMYDQKSNYDDDEFNNVIKLSLKISDHIKLEKLRQENYRANEETTFAHFFNDANDSLELKYENLNSKVDRIDISSITILGVFTAITISVFGTLDVMGNLLATINVLSIPRAIFSLSFTGLIIFDIIFLLLHTLSKFTNTTLEKNTTTQSKILDIMSSIQFKNKEPSKINLFKNLSKNLFNLLGGNTIRNLRNLRIQPPSLLF